MPPGRRKMLKNIDRTDTLSSNTKRDVNPAPHNNATAILCFTIPLLLSGYLSPVLSHSPSRFHFVGRGLFRKVPQTRQGQSGKTPQEAAIIAAAVLLFGMGD